MLGEYGAEEVEAGNLNTRREATADQSDHSGTKSRAEERNGSLTITNVTVGRKEGRYGRTTAAATRGQCEKSGRRCRKTEHHKARTKDDGTIVQMQRERL